MVSVMEMTQVLYGDVLFFVNFTMDYLTLFVTAKMLHRRLRPLRLAAAAALGAAYGVAACFMGGPVLFAVAVNLAVSLLMCYIAFSERLLPCLSLFYGSGCLLGGAMTALYSLMGSVLGTKTVFVDGGYQTVAKDIPLGWMAVVAVTVGTVAILSGRNKRKNGHARPVSVGITVGTRTKTVAGLCDSGNLLTDPIGGRPVIVIHTEALLPLLPAPLRPLLATGDPACLSSLPPEEARRVRLIPADGIGGGTVLLGYRPDGITVDGIEKEALLALYHSRFDGAEALVPAVLTENQGRKG